jgi:hypothetical protein
MNCLHFGNYTFIRGYISLCLYLWLKMNCRDDGDGARWRVHFCTPDDALVVRNILSFYIHILSQFVKPPSDTLLRYLVEDYWIPQYAPLRDEEEAEIDILCRCARLRFLGLGREKSQGLPGELHIEVALSKLLFIIKSKESLRPWTLDSWEVP